MTAEPAPIAIDPPKPAKKRWRAISLRMLMLLVLIVAGWLGWITHRAKVQRDAVAVLRRHHASVHYRQARFKFPFIDSRPVPAFLYRWLGADYFDTVFDVKYWGSGNPKIAGADGDEVMQAACRLPGLLFFKFVECELAESGADGLGGLTHLRQLDFRPDSRMSPRMVSELGQLSNLEVLLINGDGLRDEDLAFLRRLGSLQSFIMMKGTTLTDACLDEIAAAPNLTVVQLYDVPITNDGVRRLRRLKNLACLSLNRSQVDRLDDIGTFTALTQLALIGCAIEDDDLASLKTLPKLRSLNLEDTLITDVGADVLANQPSLVWIELTGTDITNASLPMFARMPTLGYLDLSNTKVTPGASTAFAAAHPSMSVIHPFGPRVPRAPRPATGKK